MEAVVEPRVIQALEALGGQEEFASTLGNLGANKLATSLVPM